MRVVWNADITARSAGAQSATPVKRREVVIKGRRVRTIDVHAHCVIPEALALTGRSAESAIPVKGQDQLAVVVDERLRLMDAQGIDVEALSINPYWYGMQRELAENICSVQNDKLAALCASRPDRFVGYASLALQFPDLAVQQLEYAVKKLDLRGAAIGGSVAGMDFSNPKFHPVWAKAEDLGVLLFIHPAVPSELAQRYRGNLREVHRT